MSSASLQRFEEARHKLDTVLNELARVAEERGETIIETDKAQLSQSQKPHQRLLAEILRQRAEIVRKKQAFRLAVVGEFKVGKSTLINALLGRQILSSDRQPTTAAITTLRYGQPERFRVTYLPEYQQQHSTLLKESNDLFSDIAKYTSDPAQTGNRLVEIMQGKEISLAEKIKEVEVWCAAEFLRDQKIEIIDTPGLGSVILAHKTATYSLIPEVDATLYLFSSDPGIKKADIVFLKFLREYVNQMLFVMTKADYVDNEQELEEKLHFNRETIITKVTNIHVQQIYAVSSTKALESQYEESGFPEFTEALQRFLVKSSGTARLQVPLEFARLNWTLLQDHIERDLEIAKKSLSEVREVREKLEQHRQEVIQRKRDLTRYITDTIENMIDNAINNIDVLPNLLQKVVEKELDSSDLNELKRFDQYMLSIIKDEVEKWFKQKEQYFNNKSKVLQQRVEDDLRTILKTIQEWATSVDKIQRIDIAMPQIQEVFNIGKLQPFSPAARSTLTAGLILSCIFQLSIWGGLTVGGAALPAFLPMIPFVTSLVTASVGDALSSEARLRNRLKKAMNNKMPNSHLNFYQAVIEGYVDDQGNCNPGIRQNITESFNAWSHQLKSNIEFIVTNNLNNYQQHLEQRIETEENGQWNREAELEALNRQTKSLAAIDKQLTELETAVEKLSDTC